MAVEFQIDGSGVCARRGQTLFELATSLGVRVPSSCRQQGKCGECLVEVTDGMERLSAPAPEEVHLGYGFRLSCRCRVESDVGMIVVRSLRRGAMRIQSSGASNVPCSLESSFVRHEGNVFRDGKMLAPFDGDIHGVALDLGTTTVVARLYNLESGVLVSSLSFENPQRFGGSDVMARIQFDTEHKGKLLQRALIASLGHCIEDFPVDPKSICEIVVAGNTTMRDLFFGFDVSSIGQRPYRSRTESQFREGEIPSTSVEMPASRLRLRVNPDANVYGLPLISGHVGGDTSACLLAIGAGREDRLFALMDIGTNTELVVGRKDRLFAASCPAGPAFEGGAIRHGMPGMPGAIERVRIDSTGRIHFDTIGGENPVGICGSGMVSLLAGLLSNECINELGRIESGDDHVVVDSRSGVCFYESDINELAQAKGANAAGIRIVLDHFGVDADDLEVFYLAGGFGQHLDLTAARQIGLIPDVPEARLHQVGNAAIEGASIALLNVGERRRLETLVQSVVHVELETDPHFFDHFVEGCQFRPFGGKLVI